MKPRAIFVNTSRGGIVDEAALAVAMRERGLRVGLDVFEPEPAAGVAEFQPAVASAGRFVGTHHIGASTEQAQNAIAAETVRICREFLATGRVPNVVNVEEHAPAECQLVVRHHDKVGVLASVLGHPPQPWRQRRGHEQHDLPGGADRGGDDPPDAGCRAPEVVAEIAGSKGAVIAVEVKAMSPSR